MTNNAYQIVYASFAGTSNLNAKHKQVKMCVLVLTPTIGRYLWMWSRINNNSTHTHTHAYMLIHPSIRSLVCTEPSVKHEKRAALTTNNELMPLI